jgi:hypothetical protein
MTAMTGNDRRRYHTYPFVDKKLQFNFSLLLAAVGLANAVYFSLFFFFYSRESFLTVANWLPERFLSPELLEAQLGMWLHIILFVAVPETVLLLLLGLFFTHRISGPLRGVSLRLKKIAEGEVPEPIFVRRFYFLSDLALQMNKAISALQAERTGLEGVLKSLEAGDVDQARSRIRQMVSSQAPRTEAGSSALENSPKTPPV